MTKYELYNSSSKCELIITQLDTGETYAITSETMTHIELYKPFSTYMEAEK